MKKLLHLLSILVIAISFAACDSDSPDNPDNPNGGTENPENPVADPAGTITLKMRNKDNGKTYLDSYIYIDDGNNFTGAEFVDVGPVAGLGNVTSIPKVGWTSTIAVNPGHGYVAYTNGTFYRLYVTGWTLTTGDLIIGAEVKYQKNFSGKAEAIVLPTTGLNFNSKGGTQTILFENTSIIPFDLYVNNNKINLDSQDRFIINEWLYVQPCSTEDFYFLVDGLYFVVNETNMALSSDVDIELVVGLNKTTLHVVRQGSNPIIEVDSPVTLNGAGIHSFDIFKSNQTVENCAFIQVPLYTNIPIDQIEITSEDDWLAAWISDVTSNLQKKSIKWVGKIQGKESQSIDSNVANAFALNIAAKPNYGKDRTGILELSYGEITFSISVIQTEIQLNFDQTELWFDRTATSQEVFMDSPFGVNIKPIINANWVQCYISNNKLTIAVEPTSQDREAVIKFEGFDSEIHITQSKYAIGDICLDYGVESIVCKMDGAERFVQYCPNVYAPWSTEYTLTGATSLSDGEYNTNMIHKLPFWRERYPAFAVVEDLNINGISGWFMPAKEQIVGKYLNFRFSFTDMNGIYCYWTSSEASKTETHAFTWYAGSKGYYSHYDKSLSLEWGDTSAEAYLVCAMHRF